MVLCIIGGSPIVNAVIADSFDDKSRARAAGLFYAIVNGVASFIGPAIALFTKYEQGWRYAMWTIGAICIAAALIVAFGFKDPGVGAAEAELSGLNQDQRARKVTVSAVIALFKIPTYTIMMLSRLLSGHLLIGIFGVVFLVNDRGFDNATAAIVLMPFGIGYVVGSLGGSFIVTWLDKVFTKEGRPVFLVFAQVAFAVSAFFATQVYEGQTIAIYGMFWALMGMSQAFNVPVNRPMVTAVILPELRGQGFAIWLSIFETIGWAIFSLVGGALASAWGIQTVFFWILVVMMLVNAALLSLTFWTYPRDAKKVTDELARRRAEALNAKTV